MTCSNSKYAIYFPTGNTGSRESSGDASGLLCCSVSPSEGDTFPKDRVGGFTVIRQKKFISEVVSYTKRSPMVVLHLR